MCDFLDICRNLQFAAEQLESTGIIGVIEPINNYSVPGYYLNSYDKGVIQTCVSINYICSMFILCWCLNVR